MPEELQLLTLVVAGSIPAPATRRQGSSVVEHETFLQPLLPAPRQMPKELHSRVANVQVRVLLLPCRIVQWVETRPLISSILVVGLLSFWCGGFIGAPQPFYERMRAGLHLLEIASILPLLVIRFGRMPTGLQPFTLSILLLLVAALFKEKNNG